MAEPCPSEIIIIASIDNPSPNATTDKITDNGPKNTSAYVAIASASQFLGVTTNERPANCHIKDSD